MKMLFAAVGLSLAILLLPACDQSSGPGAGAGSPSPMPPPPPAPAASPPLSPATQATAASNPVRDFDQTGVMVDVLSFFKAAEGLAMQPGKAGVPTKALVTADGVYSFIETPENQQALDAVEVGSVARVRGKLLVAGRLLHADQIDALPAGAANINLLTVADDAGSTVTLNGVNKCQCGIKVAELHTSCALGHLHHLEAEDGNLYHYLPTAAGREAFLGNGSHFKKVRITALVLPGHYLLVQETVVQP